MRSFALSCLVVLSVACGQGAPPAGGDHDLPNAVVGPYRPLRKPSEGDSAPHVLGRTQNVQWQNPGVLALEGAPGKLPFALFVEKEKGTGIFRVDYEDPTQSKGQVDAVEVLTPTLAWEAGRVAHPFPLRVGATARLYYSAGGCIGLAESADLSTWTKRPEPLACDGAAPLSAPGVVLLPDGTTRLFAARGDALVEARSADGVSFSTFEAVLAPSAPAGPADEPDQPFDAATVGDPHPFYEVGADGRAITYVYFTGKNRAGAHAIGLAARFGEGSLTRAVAPVFTRFDPRSPTTIGYGAIRMLYVVGRGSEGNAGTMGSVLAGLTPATASLP